MKKTVACKACQSVNDYEAETCARCGESLALPRLEAIAADMRAITARSVHQQAVHANGFSSINGFGTMLLDYRPHGEGTWEAVRWVTAAGIPLVPLGGYVIQPFHEESTYGRHTASFSIVDRVPLSAQRIVRTYLLLAAGVLPVLLGALNARWVNRTLGGGLAFFAMLACFAWAGYVVHARIPNAGKVYKRLPPRVAT